MKDLLLRCRFVSQNLKYENFTPQVGHDGFPSFNQVIALWFFFVADFDFKRLRTRWDNL